MPEKLNLTKGSVLVGGGALAHPIGQGACQSHRDCPCQRVTSVTTVTLAIDIAAMANAYYVNKVILWVNFIDNAIVAFAQRITTFFIAG